MSWRTGELIEDALRNLMSSWVRSLVVLASATLVVGALTWSELATTTEILAFERDFVQAGGRLLIATGAEGVSSVRCDALSNRTDIVRSGSLKLNKLVESNVSEGTLFQSGQASLGALGIWSSGSVSANSAVPLFVGADAASELGLEDGAYLGVIDDTSTDPVVSEIRVFDSGARFGQANRWLLTSVAPHAQSDSCWVEPAAGATAYAEELVAVLVGDANNDITIRPWISLDEFSRDPVAELKNRPLRNAWTIGALVLTGILWLSIWYRRTESNLYRLLGSSRAEIVLLVQLEVLVLLGVGTVLGVLWATAAFEFAADHQTTFEQYLIVLRSGVSVSLGTVAIAPLAGFMTGRERGLLQLLKE